MTKRLLGVGITVFCAVGLAVIYDSIPGGSRFPVVILAVPAVAVAAGIFQAITGMTLFEANENLPRNARLEANRRLAQDPEWLRKHAEAMRRNAANPGWRLKRAETNRRMAADPVWRAKNAAARRGKKLFS